MANTDTHHAVQQMKTTILCDQRDSAYNCSTWSQTPKDTE